MKQTLIALALTVVTVAPAMADQALAASKNCMACHAVDKKLVGPSYKDVASKYAGQKDAVDKLAAKIMNCLLYTSPSPRDLSTSRMPSSA